MYAHRLMRLARYAVWGRSSVRFHLLTPWWFALAVVVLGACSGGRAEGQTPHPADSEARVRPAPYRSVTRGYVSRRPVEPQPWRGRNDAVTPQEKK
jgi:hypothetical protein